MTPLTLLVVGVLLVLGCTSAFLHPVATGQRHAACASSSLRMSSILADAMSKPILDDDYIAVGLACCFQMNSSQKLAEKWIFEPLTAGTLETIELGVPTSYKRVLALRAADYFLGDVNSPDGINVDALQALVEDEQDVTICEEPVERSVAAIRTFKRRPAAMLIGVNEMADEYNFNLERKRILNDNYVPNDDDNIKQDISIDVYGRSDEVSADQVKELENL